MFTNTSFFSVTWHQEVKVASGQISSHLSHQVNRGIGLSMTNPLEMRGPSGAVYLPMLEFGGGGGGGGGG